MPEPLPKTVAEMSSADQAAFLRSVLEASTEYSIVATDLNGRILAWNEGARRLKGYTAQEILGRHFSAFYPPEQVAAGLPQEILDAAKDKMAEVKTRDTGCKVLDRGSGQFGVNCMQQGQKLPKQPGCRQEEEQSVPRCFWPSCEKTKNDQEAQKRVGPADRPGPAPPPPC